MDKNATLFSMLGWGPQGGGRYEPEDKMWLTLSVYSVRSMMTGIPLISRQDVNGFVPAKFSEGCLLKLGKVRLGWFRLPLLVYLDLDIILLCLAEVFEGLLCGSLTISCLLSRELPWVEWLTLWSWWMQCTQCL